MIAAWRPTRRSTKRHGPRESREGGSRPPVAGRGLAPSSLRGLIFLLLLAGEKRDVPLAVEAGEAVPEDDVGHFVSDVDRRAAGPGPARRLRPPRRLRARDRREGGPRSPRGSSPALTLPPPDRTFVLEIQPWLPRVSRSAAQAGNARATRIADLLVGEPMDDPVLGIELVADSVETVSRGPAACHRKPAGAEDSGRICYRGPRTRPPSGPDSETRPCEQHRQTLAPCRRLPPIRPGPT